MTGTSIRVRRDSRQLNRLSEQGVASRGSNRDAARMAYRGNSPSPSLSVVCRSSVYSILVRDPFVVFPTHPLQVSIAQVEGDFRCRGVRYLSLQPAAAGACWLATLSVIASAPSDKRQRRRWRWLWPAASAATGNP